MGSAACGAIAGCGLVPTETAIALVLPARFGQRARLRLEWHRCSSADRFRRTTERSSGLAMAAGRLRGSPPRMSEAALDDFGRAPRKHSLPRRESGPNGRIAGEDGSADEAGFPAELRPHDVHPLAR